MPVIKNVRDHDVTVDGVAISPGEQLEVNVLSSEMNDALDRGDLVLGGDATAEERKADAEALKPFKVGDPAIDGN